VLARSCTYRNEQTVFYLEDLREEWLPTRRERWLSKAGIVLACVVVSGLLSGLTFGPSSFGLIFGLIFILTKPRSVEILRFSFADPKPRIAKALRDGLRGGLLYGLIVGLFGGGGWPIFGMTAGMTAGMVAGYMGGGLFAIRHSVLRLALWLRGSAPLNYVPFLDYAVERLFLRKVGGGYIFIRRMLLEYFATPEEPSGRPD
jgi:hypothetical protein